MPLPMPKRGGSLANSALRELRPMTTPSLCLCGFISTCFLADGPFPLLVLTGVQGSAKSTTARVLKSLIDPERVKDRSALRDTRDLAIWACGSRLLLCDNLSGLPDWLSDAFCRLATGGGFGTRTLYENDEETIFSAKRPIILNGIEDVATRGDLLERSIVLRHPAIAEADRKLEADLWADFDEAKPRLLGAILDRVSTGLKALPSVDKSRPAAHGRRLRLRHGLRNGDEGTAAIPGSVPGESGGLARPDAGRFPRRPGTADADRKRRPLGRHGDGVVRGHQTREAAAGLAEDAEQAFRGGSAAHAGAGESPRRNRRNQQDRGSEADAVYSDPSSRCRRAIGIPRAGPKPERRGRTRWIVSDGCGRHGRHFARLSAHRPASDWRSQMPPRH